MNRRDFVKLFSQVPIAAGAATFLGITKAAEPVIDILVPEKELILPESSLNLTDTVIINEVDLVDFSLTNPRFGVTSASVDLEAYLYDDLADNLLSGKYSYFMLALETKDSIFNLSEYQYPNALNNVIFKITAYNIITRVGSFTKININGSMTDNYNIGK